MTTLHMLITFFSALTGFLIALNPVRRWVVKVWNATIGRRGRQLDRIEQELRPNGHTSMRDAIDRIEDRQDDFEAFLNAQLNIGDEAVFRTDPNGHVITNNRKHQNLTGFSMAQVEGDGWINVIHPDWRSKTHTKWHEAVSDGREFSEDIMYVSPQGDNYMVHVNAFRERDAKGKIRGYLGVVTPLVAESITCPHIGVCAAATAGHINEENS
jgi:PAS domain S-box-containing protein